MCLPNPTPTPNPWYFYHFYWPLLLGQMHQKNPKYVKHSLKDFVYHSNSSLDIEEAISLHFDTVRNCDCSLLCSNCCTCRRKPRVRRWCMITFFPNVCCMKTVVLRQRGERREEGSIAVLIWKIKAHVFNLYYNSLHEQLQTSMARVREGSDG